VEASETTQTIKIIQFELSDHHPSAKSSRRDLSEIHIESSDSNKPA
jgi:hypothetical protein